ncbi:hypothetical protein BJ878DRAFT_520674 [Calycina marina]|uniref:Secreted protein n=1 Tax=Calycina marina TaxID=1763456 RepID=A0A9P7YX64_9HELO|nr:hypothetical protein BJ878DRAFT_520674 [Calycina marina]
MRSQQLTALHHLHHSLLSGCVALLLRMPNVLGRRGILSICPKNVWRLGIFQRLATQNRGTDTAPSRTFSLAVLLGRGCIYRGITASKRMLIGRPNRRG